MKPSFADELFIAVGVYICTERYRKQGTLSTGHTGALSSTLNAWYFNPKESCGAQAEQTPMLPGAYTCSVVQWMGQRVSGKQIPSHLRLSLERGNCLMSPVPDTQALTAIP